VTRLLWASALACVAAALICLENRALAAPAPAQPPSGVDSRRVLLIVDQSDDPFANRVRAELLALGLDVVAVEPWRTGEAVDTLEGAARAAGAVAAVRTIASRKGVEIWMADQLTGRPLLRQLVVDENPAGPNQSLIALQTAELMRTSLLATAAPPRAPPPPVVEVPAPPPAPAEIGVEAGAGTLWSPGGTGAPIQLWVSVHRSLARLPPLLSLAIDFSAPARAATVSGPEGSSTVQTYRLAAALLARKEIAGSGLVLDGGLGVGGVRLAFEGTARAPLDSGTAKMLTVAGYARADAVFDAASWLRLGARGIVGASAHRASIQFAGNETATWGPLFVAALGVVEIYF